MSKKIKMLILAFALFTTQITTVAATGYEVKPCEYTFAVEEAPVNNFPAICINGEYYAPLSYVAEFSGCHTELDKENTHLIHIMEGNSKDAQNTISMFNVFVKNTKRKVVESKDQIAFNGQIIEVKLLKVDGYNFVNVKDMAAILNRYLCIDENNKIMEFTTDVFKTFSNEQQAPYLNYIKEHELPINKDLNADKALLEQTGLDQYPIILMGENHAITKNYTTELYWLKYLNQYANTHYLIMEEGYCDAQLINQYLKTGDNTILETIMENLKGTYCGSNEQYEFYKALYAYNKSLPEDKKIEVIGVDVQHQTVTGLNYVNTLLPSKEAPEELKEKLAALKVDEAVDENKYNALIALKDDMASKQSTYEAYIGADFDKFSTGINNILQGLEYYKTEDNYFREQKLIENFEAQYKKLNGAKVFGIFGGMHTSLNMENYPSMAACLNTQVEATKGKIASISLMYYNCSYMERKTGESIPMTNTMLSKSMAEAVETDIGLLRLDHKDSIFAQDGSTKTQQYIIIVKDSRACTLYK